MTLETGKSFPFSTENQLNLRYRYVQFLARAISHGVSRYSTNLAGDMVSAPRTRRLAVFRHALCKNKQPNDTACRRIGLELVSATNSSR